MARCRDPPDIAKTNKSLTEDGGGMPEARLQPRNPPIRPSANRAGDDGQFPDKLPRAGSHDNRPLLIRLDGDFRGLGPKPPLRTQTMNKLIPLLAALFVAGSVHAQVDKAATESGKTAADTARQASENAKAAVSDQPEKTMHKAKAGMAKTGAKYHKHEAKGAAKDAVK